MYYNSPVRNLTETGEGDEPMMQQTVHRGVNLALIAVVLGWGVGSTLAQEAAPRKNPIAWQEGPVTGKLGDVAEIKVPEGFRFADGAGARKFLELTHNPASGSELGVLISPQAKDEEFWFVIFEFDETGYVKDDEKDKLNADKVLATIREGNDNANKERQKRGWDTVDVVGWEQKPFYEPDSHNLSWSIRGRTKEGDVVNYSTRLLGRRGVMQADLVLSPGQLAREIPVFHTTVGGFTFTSGNRYAEFRPGDKIAKYGLTALIAGGAGALAAKSGLLAKFWKLIVAGVVAAAAALKRLWARLTGREATRVSELPPPTPGT
jgi:uncharacterized membrane-anchored protein